MNDVLYLAWRYLAYYRAKHITLIAAITIIVYLPIALNILVNESARQLTVRAGATPLLVGAKGSPLELVLSSLYFESDVPPVMRYAEVTRVQQSELATAIPLHTRFRTRHSPIVGTTLEYFAFRGLTFRQGRPMGMLGECVLGAGTALASGLKPGDSIMSTPQNLFDIAGVYPLKMQVVGVLGPTGGPDDEATFVDIKTAWVIEGLAHGHQDLSQQAAASNVLRKEGNEIIANASVMQYNEITSDNVGAFHFHGDPAEFPLTAAIVVPHDDKSSTLLQGRYLGGTEPVQIVRPAEVMSELMQTVLTVRRYVLFAVVLLGIATLATMTLVFLLSWQLRRREIETIIKIGGSRFRVAALLATEALSVLCVGAACAMLLAWATSWLATSATRWLIQLT